MQTVEYQDKYILAKNMYLNNARMIDIKNSLGMDMQIFRNNLRREGLFVDRNIDSGLNDNVFEVIDTEEKAYWLGMMLADGYVDEKYGKFELTLKDREHIVKFKSFLNSRCIVQTKIAMGHEYYRLSIRNKKLSMDLSEKGVFQKKSCLVKFPDESIVPNFLMRHFVRGYFDGNGGVGTHLFGDSRRKNYILITLDSSKEFLDDLISKYNFLPITKYVHTSRIYEYRTTQRDSIKLFLDILYKDSKIYLDRKYNKYNDYFNKKEI